MTSPGGFHYFNFNQKIFELGEDSTLGALTWGLGGLGPDSHRTQLALLADDIKKNLPTDVTDVADRWATQFWTAYSTSQTLSQPIQRCKALDAKKPFDAGAASPDSEMRTQLEELEFQQLKRELVVGFCIAGYVSPDRNPIAYEIIFDPLQEQPAMSQISDLSQRFWGAPNMIERLIVGADPQLKNQILTSGKWNGSEVELNTLMGQLRLAHPVLPIREAIDFVHACIYSTIKAIKFSNFSQICGGPIEIAVITSDRAFRWVRHKDWDSAILEGAL